MALVSLLLLKVFFRKSCHLTILKSLANKTKIINEVFVKHFLTIISIKTLNWIEFVFYIQKSWSIISNDEKSLYFSSNDYTYFTFYSTTVSRTCTSECYNFYNVFIHTCVVHTYVNWTLEKIYRIQGAGWVL